MLLSAGGAADGGTAGAAGAATGGGTGAGAAGAGALTRPAGAGAGAGTAARPDGAGTGAIAGGAGSAGLAAAAGSGAAGDGVRLGSIEVDLSQILPISSIRPGLSSVDGAAPGGTVGAAGAPSGALGAALACGGVAARWAITADIIAGDITSTNAATATRAGPAIIQKPKESNIGRTVVPVRRSGKQKRPGCDITQRRHARGERLTAPKVQKARSAITKPSTNSAVPTATQNPSRRSIAARIAVP